MEGNSATMQLIVNTLPSCAALPLVWAMRRNNNLHTAMIIPKDRTREMSEFWVLEFADIERTIEKKTDGARTSANIGRLESFEPTPQARRW
jgi:hypothetical protein